MKSYATIDRFVGRYAVLEVEMLETSDSRPEDFAIKETDMYDVDADYIRSCVGPISESDVLVVEHGDGHISNIISNDFDEKTRRINLLACMM
jgi:hypothetical protein